MLAHDTEGTLDGGAPAVGARSARPNVMIKVPATPEGIPAIEQLIAEGINVNVTLLFAHETLRAVAAGLHRGPRGAAAARRPLGHGRQRRQLLRQPHRHADRRLHRDAAGRRRRAARAGAAAQSLLGKVAIANAKLTYQRYQERSSPARAGRRWPRRARRRSGCCGPAPAPRTRPTATCSTSRS